MENAFNLGIHEFAVYSQRSKLVKYVVFFLITELLVIVLFSFFLFLASGFPFVRPSPDPSLVIVIQILMAICSLLALFLIILLLLHTISTIRRFVSHKPALLLTHQGIDFQNLPFTGNTFFSWGEMASLSIVPVHQSHSKPINYLCLDMKDHVQFLSRFHPLRRFFVPLGSVPTGTLISVPQWFLSEPVEELLLQIRENFREELRTYNVQILSTYPEEV